MRRAIFAATIIFAIACGGRSLLAASRLEKVSDHCYYLHSTEGEKNVAAVVTEEGILIIDPPSEDELSNVVESLKSVTSKAVRWVVFTNPRYTHVSGARFFAEQGAVFLASAQLRKLSADAQIKDSRESAASNSTPKDGSLDKAPDSAWFIFDRQMRLFPSNLEIRIFALQREALTGGDVVVFLPAEKVLFVGSLYEFNRYPDIDAASGGNALGWIDGLKQVIDSVPLLKAAIPQAKPAPKPEPEKTLEEGIKVVSSSGKASNLQNINDLLDAAQKLRSEISRAVRAGRSCDSFLASPNSSQYRNYGNLDSYACQLFEDLRRR